MFPRILFSIIVGRTAMANQSHSPKNRIYLNMSPFYTCDLILLSIPFQKGLIAFTEFLLKVQNLPEAVSCLRSPGTPRRCDIFDRRIQTCFRFGGVINYMSSFNPTSSKLFCQSFFDFSSSYAQVAYPSSPDVISDLGFAGPKCID